MVTCTVTCAYIWAIYHKLGGKFLKETDSKEANLIPRIKKDDVFNNS